MTKLVRLTKNGVNHAVRDKHTVCGLMLGHAPLEPGEKRLCVQCKAILKREEADNG